MQKTEYKVIQFRLKSKALTRKVVVSEKVGTETKTSKTIFGKEKIEEVPVYKNIQKEIRSGVSKTQKDIDSLTQEMNEQLNLFARQGWRVINITPVLEGVHDSKKNIQAADRLIDMNMIAWGAGWGYSLTKAFVVTLERNL